MSRARGPGNHGSRAHWPEFPDSELTDEEFTSPYAENSAMVRPSNPYAGNSAMLRAAGDSAILPLRLIIQHFMSEKTDWGMRDERNSEQL